MNLLANKNQFLEVKHTNKKDNVKKDESKLSSYIWDRIHEQYLKQVTLDLSNRRFFT